MWLFTTDETYWLCSSRQKELQKHNLTELQQYLTHHDQAPGWAKPPPNKIQRQKDSKALSKVTYLHTWRGDTVEKSVFWRED